ncbi:hypothetical protein B0A55_12955, partial [Friedmanniomyces simplex]
ERSFVSQQQPVSSGDTEPAMYHQAPASMAMQAPQQGQDQQAQQQILSQLMAQPAQPAASSSMPVGMDSTDVNDTSMMEDMDVGDSNIDFGESQLDVGETGNDVTSILPAPGPNPPAPDEIVTTQPPPTEQQQQQQSAQPPTTTALQGDTSLVGADSSTLEGNAGLGDDSLFDESMFGDLTNTGDTSAGDVGDGEFDFAAAAGGMDDNAFGEATFGMGAGEGGQQGGQ